MRSDTSLPLTSNPHAGRATRAALAGLLLLQLIIGLYGVDAPIRWGHQGYHVGEHGLGARNLLRYGVWQDSLHHDFGPPPNSSLNFHHVSMLQVPLAAMYLAFGEEPWTARSIAIFFSLLAAAGVFAFARRARGDPEAVAAMAAFVLNPLHASFCNLPDIQIISISAAVWLGVAILRLLQNGPKWSTLLLLWGATLLGGCFDWPFYPVSACMFASAAWELRPFSPLARRPTSPWTRKQLNGARLAVLVSGMILAGILVQHFVRARLAGQLGDLLGSAVLRSATGSMIDYLGFVAHRLVSLQSVALPVVFAAWLLARLVRWRVDRAARLVLAMAVGQLVWVLKFGNEFRIHEYRSYWFVLPFALAAGDAVVWLVRASTAVLPQWARANRPQPPSAAGLGRRLRRLGGGATRALYSATAVLLVFGPVAERCVELVVLSRERFGCIDTGGYEPQTDRMVAAKVVSFLADDNTLVLIHDSMDPRTEMWWLVDAPSRPFHAPAEALRAVAAGRHVLALYWAPGFGTSREWASLANEGRVLLIGQVAIVSLGGTGDRQPSVEVADLSAGPMRPWWSAWLHAPATAPTRLVAGDPGDARTFADQIGAAEQVYEDIARRSHPLLDRLPPGMEY